MGKRVNTVVAVALLGAAGVSATKMGTCYRYTLDLLMSHQDAHASNYVAY
jgi:hypothetical protein